MSSHRSEIAVAAALEKVRELTDALEAKVIQGDTLTQLEVDGMRVMRSSLDKLNEVMIAAAALANEPYFSIAARHKISMARVSQIKTQYEKRL